MFVTDDGEPCDHPETCQSECFCEAKRYWFRREMETVPRPDYLQVQPDLNDKMHQLLVDWFVEVATRFKLKSATLFLAVNFLDRFLSLRSVHRRKLQLVGSAALMIACKYEEVCHPSSGDWVRISDNQYSLDHLLHMEGVVLSVLEFKLGSITSFHFLECFLRQSDVKWHPPFSDDRGQDEVAYWLCNYLLEITLLSTDSLAFKPSTLAAASIYLVRRHCTICLEQNILTAWTGAVQVASRHSAEMLMPCTDMLYAKWTALTKLGGVALVNSADPTLKSGCIALYRKYTKSKYCAVSQIQLNLHQQPIIQISKQPWKRSLFEHKLALHSKYYYS